MQPDSNSPSHGEFIASGSGPKSQRFLIPRSSMGRFLLKFTLMTIIGWVVGGIASIALEKTILELLSPPIGNPPTKWYFWIHFLNSGVFAVIFGADQGFVIHPYISGWLWMLATSTGWLIANSVSTAWINYISSMASSFNKTLSPNEILILGILSTISYIISGIWLGFSQWLVMRRYTVAAWWWNFLPSISFLLISILVWLLSLVQGWIPETNRDQIVYLIGQAFTSLILGVIPAIGLCTLKKNRT
ncbi:MAG: hypothetical protein DSM106950_19975 [Stigonema ocellatum SAG 48.90 = DSM 106950]|nr:hypothetical protein [Stigonema ocellatum SAG 48.90 = DSM 106950]